MSAVQVSEKDLTLKKSKKTKEEKDALKLEKQKKRKEHTDSGEVDGVKDKKKKKKKPSADDEVAVQINADGASTSMSVDGPANGESKAEKKKRKRDRDADADGTSLAEPSVSKKEKKKRRKESDDPLASEAVTNATESASASRKKEKKKKQNDTPSTADASTTSTPSASNTPASQDEITAYLAKHAITIHSPEGKPTAVLSFDQLAIPPRLKGAFSGFKEPTPIQACAWPPALEGRDVIGIAETGSGKTLAFGLPALAQLISTSESNKSSKKSKSSQTTISVLVVAPTRELAIQTHDTLSEIGKPFGIASVAVFGGVDKNGQVRALKNARDDGLTTRIIVGTPGRILDLVNDGTCDLSRVSYLVLDEADRMLDRGFENDIRSIIGHTVQGEGRQTLMFSATWPDAVRKLAASFLRNPLRVTVGSDDLTANSRVEQVVEVFDDARSKDDRLLAQLRKLSHKKAGSPEDSRILVFALYKKEAARVEEMLRRKGFSVGALHGDMSQNARMEALQNFKTGVTGLMVATDVAARGLDIPNVAAVINYTFPLTIEDYIHRIGRTGRGGKSGKSITFFTGDNHERALAGELARVLRESGFEAPGLQKFPMTIKKKTHGAYGAFFRDDVPVPTGPTKITFD